METEIKNVIEFNGDKEYTKEEINTIPELKNLINRSVNLSGLATLIL